MTQQNEPLSLQLGKETTLPAIVSNISVYDYTKDGERKYGLTFEFSVLNFEATKDNRGTKIISQLWKDTEHFVSTFSGGVGLYNLTGRFSTAKGTYGSNLVFSPSSAELLCPFTEKNLSTMVDSYQKLVAQRQQQKAA